MHDSITSSFLQRLTDDEITFDADEEQQQAVEMDSDHINSDYIVKQMTKNAITSSEHDAEQHFSLY